MCVCTSCRRSSWLEEGKFEKLGRKRIKGRDSLHALPTLLCLLVLVVPNQRTWTFARKDSHLVLYISLFPPSLPPSLPACFPKWAGFLFRLGLGGGRGEGRDETCKGDQMIEYVGGGRGMVGVG